mmetsp:Transcript_33216/g.37031  ORF Transcript_33216/g.37031 Transcript_33216/m.37031 type:complete len:133 (-) Transcript_33216:10-408(-)
MEEGRTRKDGRCVVNNVGTGRGGKNKDQKKTTMTLTRTRMMMKKTKKQTATTGNIYHRPQHHHSYSVDNFLLPPDVGEHVTVTTEQYGTPTNNNRDTILLRMKQCTSNRPCLFELVPHTWCPDNDNDIDNER